MPAARELMMLNRLLCSWCKERNAEHWGQFVLARADAQRVYGAARESHNERTRNTLKHSTCSNKLWEALKGSIFDVKPSIPALQGPGGGSVVAPDEKALLLGSQFDSKQCREQFCNCSVSFPWVYLQFFGLPNFCPPASTSRSWYVLGCWSFVCVSSISKDGCGYYDFKTKHIFSMAHPECWRSANVTAIPKGAPSPHRENYRPISITPILFKVYAWEVIFSQAL